MIEGSGFRDPEGIWFAARTVAKVDAADEALRLLARAIEGGFHNPAAMRRDPHLAHVAGDPRFLDLVARAERGRADSLAAYRAAGGESILGPER